MKRKTDREKPGKRHRGRLALIIGFLLILAAGALLYFREEKSNNKKSEPEIVTESQLKEIINVSELSTFTAVYNGVAQVMNEEKPEETDYYVSYEAKVNVGIDFSEIGIDKDDRGMIIRLTIPEVDITDIEVDIASLDYIFLNDKANTASATNSCIKLNTDSFTRSVVGRTPPPSNSSSLCPRLIPDIILMAVLRILLYYILSYFL